MGRNKSSKKKKFPNLAPKGKSKLLPGLGGGPWNPAAKPMSRLEMERMNRSIAKLLAEQDFDSPEEANAFLRSAVCGRNLDDIVELVEHDPEEEAQDLAYSAMEARTPVEAMSLCRQALEIDPHCLDARVLQAQLSAQSDASLAEEMKAIIRDAEAHFGEDYIDENRGHFWGLVETRPYMRARETLVALLQKTGDIHGAIAECEGMLELNPGDNQGMRDELRGLYLEAGNLDGVRSLNKQYDDSIFAVPAWSAVLEKWLSDDAKQAEKLARSAHKQNRHVAAYLSGAKPIPECDPDFYSPGDPNEGAMCACRLGAAWRVIPRRWPGFAA